ncbi:unnamed protein product [Calypogeia fissa]
MEAWSSDGGLKVLIIREEHKQDPAERAQNLDNYPHALCAAADPCAASYASGSLVVWSTVQHHCPPMLKSRPTISPVRLRPPLHITDQQLLTGSKTKRQLDRTARKRIFH